MKRATDRLLRGVSTFSACVITLLWIAPAGLPAQPTPDAKVDACLVTLAPNPRWLPAPPRPIPSDAQFDWGSEKLFVLLPYGSLRGISVPAGIRVKFPWFAGDLSPEDGTHPDLTITGRRLDDFSTPLSVEGPNAAWSTRTSWRNHEAPDALVSALIFPEPGCWEIAARRKRTEFRFAVRVSRL